jgi:hypothetical protein
MSINTTIILTVVTYGCETWSPECRKKKMWVLKEHGSDMRGDNGRLEKNCITRSLLVGLIARYL